jgi:transposase-like protein
MFATEMYSVAGIGLRTLADKMLKYFDIRVSHETIRQWVASQSVVDKIRPGKVWHADETYIRIKGKGHWLWVVYCADTKQVIAWHLSSTRLYKDALAVMKKAVQASNGTRPEKITTDGLWQYPCAIFKAIGWNWHEHRKAHLVDSGIGKNAIIERVNREIKRRIKWFSTFQSLEGANAFFALWFNHFNKKWSITSELT